MADFGRGSNKKMRETFQRQIAFIQEFALIYGQIIERRGKFRVTEYIWKMFWMHQRSAVGDAREEKLTIPRAWSRERENTQPYLRSTNRKNLIGHRVYRASYILARKELTTAMASMKTRREEERTVGQGGFLCWIEKIRRQPAKMSFTRRSQMTPVMQGFVFLFGHYLFSN